MADKDHGTTDPPEAAGDALHIAFERVQAMLGAHHFVPVRLQCGDQLLETRAIGPKSVGEYDARFVLICHSATPDLIWLLRRELFVMGAVRKQFVWALRNLPNLAASRGVLVCR